MRTVQLRAELPSIHSLHTGAPGAKCTRSCPPSYTFSSPVPWELLEPLIIPHSGPAEKEAGRAQVSGQGDCAWGTGRGEHASPAHCDPTFLPIPSQLPEFKISFGKPTLWNRKQSSMSFSKRSTAPSKAPRAQNPTSTPHLLQCLVTCRSKAPRASSSLPFSPKGPHSSTECKLQPVLFYIQFVNWLLKAEENQLSLATKGEVMLHFQVCGLLLLKLPMPHEPTPLCPPFPWRRSHIPTPQPALLNTAPDFLQQREGEKIRTSWWKAHVLSLSSWFCAHTVPDIVWFYMQVTQSFFSHVHQVLLENVAIIHQVLSFSQLPEEE